MGKPAKTPEEQPERNGALKIPLPFDEALRAALEVEPKRKPARRPAAKEKKRA